LMAGAELVEKSSITVDKTDSNKTRRRQTPAGGDDNDDGDEKQKRKSLENKVYKQCSIFATLKRSRQSGSA